MQSSVNRTQQVMSHLAPSAAEQSGVSSKNVSSKHAKSDDDVVIVSALRTPIAKAKRGGFKDTHPCDLLTAILKGTIERSKINPALVDDIVVGTVLAPGGGAAQARMASFLAGFPDTTAVTTLNRQCSSGLQAVANVAASISNGFYDIGIAAGIESMSQHSMTESVGSVSNSVFENDGARNCLYSMGETSENVAEKFGINRDVQDRFALNSQLKAAKAAEQGLFQAEIYPVTTTITDKEGNEKTITVSKDEGIRKTTLEGLQKLRAAFKQDGSTTAGNSSQVSDGAAAVLLMKRKKARELGLTPLGTFRSFSVVGVPPEIMGIGPARAIPLAVEKANLTLNDIDYYEINEAFASQATYCIQKLNIAPEKVNPVGGAIALGHPLGCTGARQVATLLNQLKRSNTNYGVISMCIGTGMGAAAVLERD